MITHDLVFIGMTIFVLLGVYIIDIISSRDVKKWVDRDNTEYFKSIIMEK